MADFEHNKANLGAATLSSAITSSQTSITVDASDASTFPSTPFYATISPIGETPNLLNAEIVKVTAISSGTLTVTRGQRSTTAKAFAAGSVIFNGVYTQDLDYAQAVGRAFFTASYSAGVFYINNAMLPTTPTDGMSIRVIFSQDVTTGAVGVSLNNGTTYNVYAGAAITNIDFTTLRKVLYDGGDTGTTGDVALSDSAANYEYMVIYFRPNDGYLSSTKIHSPNGKRAFLISGYAGSGTSDTSSWNIKLKVVSISGTSITPFAYKEYNGSVVNPNNIYITRVEGWNI